MRKTMLIASSVMLMAGLTACKKAPEATDTATTEASSTGGVATTAPADVPMPAVPANARTVVVWDGTYNGTDATGAAVSLTLNKDMTYAWTAGTAAPVTGKFNWYRDAQRILLDEKGGKVVYAVADGAIYRLASTEAPVTGPFERTVMLTKVVAPAAPQ